jgi:toxin ParE1/3/4
VARVVVTPAADADTAEIIAFLAAKAGVNVAANYSAAFEKLYDDWSHFPDSGARRAKLGPNIRIGIVSPYIVICRHIKAEGALRVLRIVHAKRRITGKLLRGPT